MPQKYVIVLYFAIIIKLFHQNLNGQNIDNLNYYQYTRPNRKSASSKHTLSGPQKTDSGLLMHYQPYS